MASPAVNGRVGTLMQTYSKPNAAGAKTLDASWYGDDAFTLERDRIFARSWLCVGRTAELAEAGDFFLGRPAGESVIVTRDRAGEIRALFNVCRHRGSRLCERESGQFAGSIVCPYHAWTYGLDGRLLAARNMRDVPGFDASAYPLKAARVALWEGLVFVNLSPDAEPFERALAPLAGRFSSWRMARLHAGRFIEYDVACNWKLIFQNYSECYHCPPVHPQLDALSPSDSGRNDLLEGAVLGGYSQLRHPAAGDIIGDVPDRIFYYTIFPSLLLSLHPDYVMMHRIEPIDANHTHVVCTWLFDPEAMSECDFDPRAAVDFWDLTNRQDWHVCELTQSGIDSRAYEPGPYCDAEGLLAAFDRHYLAAMRA
jgi:Rieske 2Fe-2S family protein